MYRRSFQAVFMGRHLNNKPFVIQKSWQIQINTENEQCKKVRREK